MKLLEICLKGGLQTVRSLDMRFFYDTSRVKGDLEERACPISILQILCELPAMYMSKAVPGYIYSNMLSS